MLFKLCSYPGSEYFKAYDFILKDMILIEIPVDQNYFRFDGELQMTNTNKQSISKQMSLCIDNSKNLQFQITKQYIDILMSKICINPLNCKKSKDLQNFKIDDKIFNFNIKGINFSILDKGIFINNSNKKDYKKI